MHTILVDINCFEVLNYTAFHHDHILGAIHNALGED